MTFGVTNYRDLEVWQLAVGWVEAIYRASARWPSEEKFGLTGQIRRASVSVASNIAEGAARRSTGEYLQFVGMARGSLAEAETQLIIAERLGYLTADMAASLHETAGRVSRMLGSLSTALERRKLG